MNLILNGKIKIGTKDAFKVIELILLSILFLLVILIVKFKPVYTVTLSGKTLGNVESKKELNKDINDYINNKTGTVAVIDIAVKPEYKIEMLPRFTKTDDLKVERKIKDTAVFTYRTYAVTVNGETKAEVATEPEALELVNNIKTDLNPNIEFELGIVENYSTERLDESKDVALTKLNDFKVAKTTEYEQEQAKIAAQKRAQERALRARQSRMMLASAPAPTKSYGNVNGVAVGNPLRVNPLITSRYGERGRRRYVHTGVDLATQSGTPIYPIANGTVTFAGWQGSYGNLVIVNHGNGVESYYAHCCSINTSVGAQVSTDRPIAGVGSTGNSTGSHLHLEIRINGNPVNPQNYLY